MKKKLVLITAIFMVSMLYIVPVRVYASSDISVYDVPMHLENYYEEGKRSMGDKAFNSVARVTEKDGVATYTLQSKTMKYLSMDGKVTNIFVYKGDKGTKRSEALSAVINQNDYNQSFTFSRDHVKESHIAVAIWVDVMDSIANPNTYVPGAGETYGKLVFDWSKAKKVTTNVMGSQLTLMVNNQKIESDTPPYIANGRTMVPVRFISEALGLPVAWNGVTKTVSVGQGEDKMTLKIGDATIVKSDGNTVMIDSPAVIVDGRTMVPVRAIAELSGAKVEWDSALKAVKISQ